MSMIRITAAKMLAEAEFDVIDQPAVLIEDGKIISFGHAAAIAGPEDCIDIDLGAVTLMPGMIDAHMHTFGVPSTGLHALPFEREPYRALRAAGELRELLHAGFTSARCLGSSVGPDLRRAIEEGACEGPRLVAAGHFISSTAGTWDAAPVPLGYAQAHGDVADGVDGVRAAVRQRVRSGADFIKVGLSKGAVHDRYHAWGDDPLNQVTTYSLEEVTAATEEAHRNGLKVSAHAIGEDAVKLALDGNVDVIEHGYGISEQTRQRLADTGTIVVTTISQLYFHRAAYEKYNYPEWERQVYERHWQIMQRDFKLGLERGVRFALGTDLIGKPTHPLNQASMEFFLAHEWGMTNLQALQAGTSVAAEVLGIRAKTGVLKQGMMADLIAVEGDPLKDVSVLQKVRLVMKSGIIIKL